MLHYVMRWLAFNIGSELKSDDFLKILSSYKPYDNNSYITYNADSYGNSYVKFE